jgi:hypothetical protein
MIVIAALTFACGIALAQYYRVFVLVPATILVLAGVSTLEALSGHAPGRPRYPCCLAHRRCKWASCPLRC